MVDQKLLTGPSMTLEFTGRLIPQEEGQLEFYAVYPFRGRRSYAIKPHHLARREDMASELIAVSNTPRPEPPLSTVTAHPSKDNCVVFRFGLHETANLAVVEYWGRGKYDKARIPVSPQKLLLACGYEVAICELYTGTATGGDMDSGTSR